MSLALEDVVIESRERSGQPDDLTQAVAASLAVWRELNLELGDAAFVTSGHRLSRLLTVVAQWIGAVPVVLVGDASGAPIAGVTTVPTTDPMEALKSLQGILGQRPGVVVAEMSGRADHVDVLLEAIPPMTRILFGGEARERLTIDFYVNVHRKGLLMRSAVVDAGFGQQLQQAAARLLEDPRRAEEARAALAAR